MQMVAVSGCVLIIIGYLALGFHYFHEARALSRPADSLQSTDTTKEK
jgi:hypothetical protein